MASDAEREAAAKGIARLYTMGYAHFMQQAEAALTAAEKARTDALVEARRVTDELLPEARTEPTQVSKHETGQPCCGPLECADSECWQPESPNGDISGGNATSLPPSNRTVTPIPDEAVQPRRCEPCDVEGYDECRCGRLSGTGQQTDPKLASPDTDASGAEQPQDKEARNMAEVEEVRVSDEAVEAGAEALAYGFKPDDTDRRQTHRVLTAALPHLHREWARGRTFYDQEAAIRADTLAKVRERIQKRAAVMPYRAWIITDEALTDALAIDEVER